MADSTGCPSFRSNLRRRRERSRNLQHVTQLVSIGKGARTGASNQGIAAGGPLLRVAACLASAGSTAQTIWKFAQTSAEKRDAGTNAALTRILATGLSSATNQTAFESTVSKRCCGRVRSDLAHAGSQQLERCVPRKPSYARSWHHRGHKI